MDYLQTQLGRRCRAARQAAGWTQGQLSKEPGALSQSRIAKVENGRILPTVAYLAWLARTLPIKPPLTIDELRGVSRVKA